MSVDSSVLRARLLRWGNTVFERSIVSTVEELREAAPLGQTGDTRRGIQAQPGGTETQPASRIVSTGKGGTIVELGRRETDVRGPLMVFPWGGASPSIVTAAPNQAIRARSGSRGLVFTHHVHQPARAPRPWFEPVVQQWSETHLPQAAELVAF